MSSIPKLQITSGFYIIVGLLLLLQAAIEPSPKASGLLVLLSSGVMTLVLANGFMAALNLARVDVFFEFPIFVRAGENFEIRSFVKNRRRVSGALLLALRFYGDRSFFETREFVLSGYVGPNSTSEVTSEARFLRRGTQFVRSLRLSTTFPFGLMRFSRVLPVQQKIIVFPRATALPSYFYRRVRDGGKEGIGASRGRNGNDEVYALRAFRSGDQRSNIHWRTSARVGKPMVVMKEDHRERNFRIVIDSFVADVDASERAKLEQMVSLAAGALTHLIQQGTAIGYRHANPDVVEVAESKARAQEVMILEQLADVSYSSSPLAEWSRRAFEDMRPIDTVLVFTLSQAEVIRPIVDLAGVDAIVLSMDAPEIIEHVLSLSRERLQRKSEVVA